MANLKPGSRYTNGIVTLDVDEEKFLILRNTISVPESSQDAFFTVEGRHLNRPDLIASEVYGRPELGWILMDINNIRQPLFDLQVGASLRVPPITLVLEAIEELNVEE